MSTAPADPIATLRGFISDNGTFPSALHLRAAIAELERRAKIEARLDAMLAADPEIDVRFRRRPDGTYCVRIITHWETENAFSYRGRGPDYHTALEAALNAAGAP